MVKSIWTSWQRAGKKWSRNAGYWAGYIICKACLIQVEDEKQAVADILSIQAYEEFLKKSRIEELLEKCYSGG